MTASKDLAIKEGRYATYEGSPLSKGIFQFDMWNVTPSNRWNWEELKQPV
jgi:ribonucleoside-diphosphate reductase alpha chain